MSNIPQQGSRWDMLLALRSYQLFVGSNSAYLVRGTRGSDSTPTPGL